METKIQVLGYQGNELVIREGEALELKPPAKIKLAGDIHSVATFFAKRYADASVGNGNQLVDKYSTVIMVDREGMVITAYLNPQDPDGTEITAKLELTPELKQFCINTEKQFTREELVKIIRFNRRFFNAEPYEGILNSYMKLNLTGTTELSVGSDNRGNKDIAFKKLINSQNIPQEFVLNIPVFKGFPGESFRVEVCFETTDASVRFWFESVELNELIEVRKEQIFSKELESCQDFPIIYK